MEKDCEDIRSENAALSALAMAVLQFRQTLRRGRQSPEA